MLSYSVNFKVVTIYVFNFVAKLEKFFASPFKLMIVVSEFSIFKVKKDIEIFIWRGNKNITRSHVSKDVKNNFIDEIQRQMLNNFNQSNELRFEGLQFS